MHWINTIGIDQKIDVNQVIYAAIHLFFIVQGYLMEFYVQENIRHEDIHDRFEFICNGNVLSYGLYYQGIYCIYTCLINYKAYGNVILVRNNHCNKTKPFYKLFENTQTKKRKKMDIANSIRFGRMKKNFTRFGNRLFRKKTKKNQKN